MTNSESLAPSPERPSAPDSSGRAAIVIESLSQLRQSRCSALPDISCDVIGERLWLSGRLPSQYLKRMAQALVLGIEGVHRVVNLIEVADTAGRNRTTRRDGTTTVSERRGLSMHPGRSRGRC